jgi:hypothetical protein
MDKLNQTFRERYCHQYCCSLRSFESQVFWRCLHRSSWAVSFLIAIFHPRYFDEDKSLIQRLGNTKSGTEFLNEVIAFQRTTRLEIGTLRVKWRLRISGQRLLELMDEFVPKHQSTDI